MPINKQPGAQPGNPIQRSFLEDYMAREAKFQGSETAWQNTRRRSCTKHDHTFH